MLTANGRDVLGLDPGRVAEVLVRRADGTQWCGSGYRVNASLVLTSAHVVSKEAPRQSASVRVRFNADKPDEWSTDVIQSWLATSGDVALLTIVPRLKEYLDGTLFGSPGDRAAVLTVDAMGFPRFKLRQERAPDTKDSGQWLYRESCHIVGTVPVLSNRRSGSLELNVEAPAADPDPKHSPWEGMSGAAVWCNGCIIGLVNEHHSREGLARLSAVRVDHWYKQLSIAEFRYLSSCLGLPSRAQELQPLVRPTTGERSLEGWAAQVRDIAPDDLLDRVDELADLVRFCASPEPYLWLQGSPWAGKSAISSWFVMHPPDRVKVVSFFVLSRMRGHANSEAFTEALIEQLAILVEESPPNDASLGGQDRQRRRLLDKAAARTYAQGERLVLVVDGLDEDQWVPGAQTPSIASLLPERPLYGLKVLVTSREHPSLPSDVGANHPLRRCKPLLLRASPHARQNEIRALAELDQRLHGGERLHADIIGLVIAAGGLTRRELSELTGTSSAVIDATMRGHFGRSVKAISDDMTIDKAEPVFVMAHASLRDVGEQTLADDLNRYRDRLHSWAQIYRTWGGQNRLDPWPTNTPRFLLVPYGQLINELRDTDRLVDLASDPDRHNRLLQHTSGDVAAINEITNAQKLLLEHDKLDLALLGMLAVQRDYLANRELQSPEWLPAAWARLGYLRRAEQLARSNTDPEVCSLAQANIVVALAGREQWDKAESIARSIADLSIRTQALARLSSVMTLTDPHRACVIAEDAERMIDNITAPWKKGAAQTRIVKVLLNNCLLGQAEGIARSIGDPRIRAEALASVAEALTEAELERADSLAQEALRSAKLIADPEAQAEMVGVLAESLFLNQAESLAGTIFHPTLRPRVYVTLVDALSKRRLWDRAIYLIMSITDPAQQTDAMLALVSALIEVDLSRAARIAEDAERAANASGRSLAQARAAAAQVMILAKKELWEQAEIVTRSIGVTKIRAETLARLAAWLTRIDSASADKLAGDAQVLALSLADFVSQAAVVRVLAQGHLWVYAEALLNSIAESAAQSYSEERSNLRRYWDDRPMSVEQRMIIERHMLGMHRHGEPAIPGFDPLVNLVKELILIDSNHAYKISQRALRYIGEAEANEDAAEGLISLVGAFANAGDIDHMSIVAGQSESIIRTVNGALLCAELLVKLAEALMSADPNRAKKIAQEAGDIVPLIAQSDKTHVSAFASLLEALCVIDLKYLAHLAGDCETIARSIGRSTQQDRAFSDLANALVKRGQWSRVEELAHLITNPALRCSVLVDVINALGTVDSEKANRIAGDAERIAHSISDRYQRLDALINLLEAFVKVEMRERARNIADSCANEIEEFTLLLDADDHMFEMSEAEFRSYFDTKENLFYKWRTWLSAIAKVNEERFWSLINSIKGPLAYTLRTSVAGVLANQKELDLAERVIRHTSYSNERAQARAIDSLANTADAIESSRIIEDAIELMLPGLSTQAEGFIKIIDSLCIHRELARAERLAWAIVHPVLRWTGLAIVAKALIEDQLWDGAEGIAYRIRAGWVRAKVLGELAVALTELDQARALRLAEDARRAATIVQDAGRRANTLTQLAVSLVGVNRQMASSLARDGETAARSSDIAEIEMGVAKTLAKVYPKRAVRLARSIPEPHQRAIAEAGIVKEMVALQMWRPAEALARSILGPIERAKAESAIVKALAINHMWDRAERLVISIAVPDTRDSALLALVRELAQSHLWENAERMTLLATSDDSLLVLIRMLSQSNDIERQLSRLRRLIGRLLSTSRWMEAVPIIATFSGEEVVRYSGLMNNGFWSRYPW